MQQTIRTNLDNLPSEYHLPEGMSAGFYQAEVYHIQGKIRDICQELYEVQGKLYKIHHELSEAQDKED